MNYYNEYDKFAANWLRNLIDAELIPPGHVDGRDIKLPHRLDHVHGVFGPSLAGLTIHEPHGVAARAQGVGGRALEVEILGLPGPRVVDRAHNLAGGVINELDAVRGADLFSALKRPEKLKWAARHLAARQHLQRLGLL